MTNREQRTKRIIERYRNLPGEFYMLKGLLCLSGAVGVGLSCAEANSEEKKVDAMFDLGMIARRMDELNAMEVRAC